MLKNPKKILIMGAGALGSGIGGFLALAGHEVTFVGRKKNMDVISENGLKISGIFGEHLVGNIITKTNTKNLEKQDIIILTTKSYTTEKIALQANHN